MNILPFSVQWRAYETLLKILNTKIRIQASHSNAQNQITSFLYLCLVYLLYCLEHTMLPNFRDKFWGKYFKTHTHTHIHARAHIYIFEAPIHSAYQLNRQPVPLCLRNFERLFLARHCRLKKTSAQHFSTLILTIGPYCFWGEPGVWGGGSYTLGLSKLVERGLLTGVL